MSIPVDFANEDIASLGSSSNNRNQFLLLLLLLPRLAVSSVLLYVVNHICGKSGHWRTLSGDGWQVVRGPEQSTEQKMGQLFI